MQAPIRIQKFGCDELRFECKLKKGDFNFTRFAQISNELEMKIKGNKRLPTKKTSRPPFFFALNPINQETDCHLHFVLSRSEQKGKLDLDLTLHAIKKRPERPPADFSMERIHSLFGSVTPKQLQGVAWASYSFSDPPHKTVIPLPRKGIVPLESSLIRKSSISGIELRIEESDLGLRRVFISTSGKNRIYLLAMFRFVHDLNYSLFTELAEYAEKISSLFVLKKKSE